jgi:hypothetical protein
MSWRYMKESRHCSTDTQIRCHLPQQKSRCQFGWICSQPGSFRVEKTLLLTLPGNRIKIIHPSAPYPSSKLAWQKSVFVAIFLVQWQFVQKIISLLVINILKSACQHTHHSVTQEGENWRINKSEQKEKKMQLTREWFEQKSCRTYFDVQTHG